MKKSLLNRCKLNDVLDFTKTLQRFTLLFFFLCFFFSFAQESENKSSDVSLVIVGDAVIYSNDASFNKQITNNKSLQKNSRVVNISKDEIKIIAKNDFISTSSNVQPENSKKVKNALARNKKKKHHKTTVLSNKEIGFYISCNNQEEYFSLASVSGSKIFVFPRNDINSAKFSLFSKDVNPNSYLFFLHSLDYFWNNDVLLTGICISGYSVRPPPDLI